MPWCFWPGQKTDLFATKLQAFWRRPFNSGGPHFHVIGRKGTITEDELPKSLQHGMTLFVWYCDKLGLNKRSKVLNRFFAGHLQSYYGAEWSDRTIVAISYSLLALKNRLVWWWRRKLAENSAMCVAVLESVDGIRLGADERFARLGSVVIYQYVDVHNSSTSD